MCTRGRRCMAFIFRLEGFQSDLFFYRAPAAHPLAVVSFLRSRPAQAEPRKNSTVATPRAPWD